MPLNNGCAASSSLAPSFHRVRGLLSTYVRIVFSDVSAAAIYLFTLKNSTTFTVRDTVCSYYLYCTVCTVHVRCTVSSYIQVYAIKQLMTEGDLLWVQYGCNKRTSYRLCCGRRSRLLLFRLLRLRPQSLPSCPAPLSLFATPRVSECLLCLLWILLKLLSSLLSIRMSE